MKTSEAKAIFDQLKAEYDLWTSGWKELVRFVAPTSGNFAEDANTKRGQKIDHKTILDNTAARAVDILSAGMMSGLTSPSRSWFELTLDGPQEQLTHNVSTWLYDVKQIIERVFAKSNLYATLRNFYEEMAVFCTAVFLVEEDYDTVIHCVPMTIGEFMLAHDARGRVDTYAREFAMTTAQMVSEFGYENVPQRVQQEYANKKYNNTHTVRHLIAPNRDRKYGKIGNKNMPFVSVYWTDGHPRFLRESGYEDFPVIASRWELKRPNDSYGRGPGWRVLGDVKMLQKMQKKKLEALDKSIDPPLMVSNNVQGEVNLLPGGLTRYNSTTDAAVKPIYQVQPDLQNTEYSIEKTRKSISEQFFADLFLMISNVDAGKMTATEVAERAQEKMMILGPVLERLKNELLDPLIERAFNICNRAGILPPPPEEIQGRELQVSYISMIAQAQKATGLNSIRQAAQFAAELAQIQAATGSEVLDNVDFDGALREGLAAIGATPKMVRAEEDVQAARENRAKQQQALAQQAQMESAVKSAKALSETPLNTGSALDAVAQGGTPNA
ncbi:portal protein [Candidatus Avelusimicrobium fimicolum]|uniref:portal protein n=1 Tax=Candidatus Avelusimicrobium fimicolum TaxID=3416216 RepID=UPI003D0A626E